MLLLIGVPELFWLIPAAYLYLLTYPMERILVRYLKETGISIEQGEDSWYLEDRAGQKDYGV